MNQKNCNKKISYKDRYIAEQGAGMWTLLMMYFREGNRSVECKFAHSEYRKYQNHDPNNDAVPRVCQLLAIKRAIKFGCWIDDSAVDMEKQLDMYRQAHRMNCASGNKKIWSVDHIIELRDKGPHSSSNMQILTLSANSKKYLAKRYQGKQVNP